MEENKNSTETVPAQDQKVTAPSSQIPAPVVEKPKHSKKFKAFFIFLAFLGGFIIWFGIFIAPTLIEAIDPISKLNEAQIKACTSECSSSKDSKCVNKCLESKGSSARVTEAVNMPSLVPSPTASPAPTLSPVPTVAKKVTFVPKSSPTPVGDPTLIIKVSKGVNTVTLLNQTTGKSSTESISAPGKNYYIDPGAYRITFNEVPNCKAAYSTCYSRCTSGGDWGWDEYGNTPNINVESGKTNAISLFYADPNSPTKNPFTGCKDTQ